MYLDSLEAMDESDRLPKQREELVDLLKFDDDVVPLNPADASASEEDGALGFKYV